MERFSGDAPLPAEFRGGVLALGNFDGFHRGHQAVVARAIALARESKRRAIVATFDPHPKRFFQPDAAPFLLTTIPQRLELFAAAGVDAALVLGFDREFATLDPQAFVARLVERFAASAVVTGSDFTFGRGKGGSSASLAALGTPLGLVAETVAPIVDADGPVSSTRIRAALGDGDTATATRLLGRPFAIQGAVIHGDKLGRTIGFPTANLLLGDYQRPRYGIYAVRARLDDGRILRGAANLGIRPTFDPPKLLLEPYFFDFAEDIYARIITVELVEFLRPEEKFDRLDALTAQMERDCAEARRILA